MSDMTEDFKLMRDRRRQREAILTPSRMEFAVDKLVEAGHHVVLNPQNNKVIIIDDRIQFWPFTGWFSGKGIGSGRGIHVLLRKLKEGK